MTFRLLKLKRIDNFKDDQAHIDDLVQVDDLHQYERLVDDDENEIDEVDDSQI